MAGADRAVLLLGAANGTIATALREQGCRVTVASELAELGDQRFDTIIAAGLLEQSRDPVSLLREVRRRLGTEGRLVVRVANVAHGSVRLALLSGRFPYSVGGLIDPAHVRFFTRESAEALFEEAGFAIGEFRREERKLEKSGVPFDAALVPAEVRRTLASDPDALAYHFLLSAHPLPPEVIGFIRRRLEELGDEKDAAKRDAIELLRRVEELAGDTHAADRLLHRAFARQMELEDKVRKLEAEVAGLRLQAEQASSEIPTDGGMADP